MKKSKNVLIIACVLTSIFLFIGIYIIVWKIRFPPGPYPLLHGKSEISDIKIIQIETAEKYGSFMGGPDSDFDDNSTYTVLVEIEDIDNFIEEFHEIVFRRLFGDPTNLGGETIAIRISYNYGEIEYISYYAQNMLVKSNNKTSNYEWWHNFYACDEDEFEEFISKYI